MSGGCGRVAGAAAGDPSAYGPFVRRVCFECHQASETDPGDETSCPSCGHGVPYPVQPLFVLTGADGAGKSAVVPLLARRLKDVVVLDKDLLFGEWSDDAELSRWLRIAFGVGGSGRALMLVGHITPTEIERSAWRQLVGDVHWCLLECSDDERARRLRSRPRSAAMTDAEVDGVLGNARRLRAEVQTIGGSVVVTDDLRPPDVADRIAAWWSSRTGETSGVDGSPSERDLLLVTLRFLREAVITSASGLTDEQAHWTPDGALIPLLGIVHHLTRVEWRWIDGALRGDEVSRSEQEFSPTGIALEQALQAYRDRAAMTEDAIGAVASLDTLGTTAWGTERRSVRSILLHLIQETARHAGHADAVRELLDLRTGARRVGSTAGSG